MYACKMQYHLPSSANEPLLSTDYPGLTLLRRGKDKDVYDLGDMLLLVATDRLSAAGKSLNQGIPGKGKIINNLSAFWFRRLRHIFPNHLVSSDSRSFPEAVRNSIGSDDGRSMLVWETTPLPVRCIVRGYLAGAGWQEYQEKGEICGNRLPGGLVESQRLPSPIFTPKAKGGAGEMNDNIDFSTLEELLGKTLADLLRVTSLRLYFTAWMRAREQGVLIAETEFEFGLHDGQLMLIDECLTPDNSRFWELDKYRHGGNMSSLDKQLLIDYLESQNNSAGIPAVPEAILCRIGEKYLEVYKRFAGGRPHHHAEVFSAVKYMPERERMSVAP